MKFDVRGQAVNAVVQAGVQVQRKAFWDETWNKKYDINSKEPHDLWLFHNILKDVYGEENISIDYYFSPSKYNADSTSITILPLLF